jgi:hypothetical protein
MPLDAPPAIVRVMTDEGGYFHSYRDHGQYVAIIGSCKSACTLWLGLPEDQLCVAPQAWLGFHKPKGYAWGRLDAKSTEDATAALWAGYSAPLQARLGELTDAMVYLRGRDLIAMEYRECGK